MCLVHTKYSVNVSINILAAFTWGYQGTSLNRERGEFRKRNPPEFTLPHVL